MPDSSTEIRVVCYEIDHDGESERGREYTIVGTTRLWSKTFVALDLGSLYRAMDISQCAERASDEFDQLEMMDDDFGEGIDHFSHTSRVVEVVGHPAHPEPVRFRVRCAVKREYVEEELKPC
jgi:hypothetical protein